MNKVFSVVKGSVELYKEDVEFLALLPQARQEAQCFVNFENGLELEVSSSKAEKMALALAKAWFRRTYL